MRHAMAAAALLFLLSACHSPQTREEINRMEEDGAIAADIPGSTPGPGPTQAASAVVIDRKNDLVDFHASWPAEAAAIPALDARFRKEADKALGELEAGARDDKAMRDKDGLEFHGYSSTVNYRVAGASERLLSLDSVIDSYTGGAHGNHGTIAVLWDKALRRDIGFTGLFPNPAAANAAIARSWCQKLSEERARKRGTAPRTEEADDPFNQCPKLDEIHVIPADRDGDHRFETLRIVADPYVAGPWAEGDYEVRLPVTKAIIDTMKSDYRPNFKV